MKAELLIGIAAIMVNVVVVLVLISQERRLALQTELMTRQTSLMMKSLNFDSYLRLNQVLDDLNRLVLTDPGVKQIFSELPFVKAGLLGMPNLSAEKVAIAWMILNRYEASFIGNEMQALPEGEWEVWKNRLRSDLKIDFVRQVWLNDIGSFAYNSKFRNLVATLLEPMQGPKDA